jgi:hypothetical protein
MSFSQEKYANQQVIRVVIVLPLLLSLLFLGRLISGILVISENKIENGVVIGVSHSVIKRLQVQYYVDGVQYKSDYYEYIWIVNNYEGEKVPIYYSSTNKAIIYLKNNITFYLVEECSLFLVCIGLSAYGIFFLRKKKKNHGDA